jgi:hypothetical protein
VPVARGARYMHAVGGRCPSPAVGAVLTRAVRCRPWSVDRAAGDPSTSSVECRDLPVSTGSCMLSRRACVCVYSRSTCIGACMSRIGVRVCVCTSTLYARACFELCTLHSAACHGVDRSRTVNRAFWDEAGMATRPCMATKPKSVYRVCPCRLASRDLRARVRMISSCLGKGRESNTGLATANHIIAVAGRAGAKLVTTTATTPVAGAVKLGLELDARPIDGPRGGS